MRGSSPALFPMFVKLTGRRCVVVGGGALAESKIESLLASGADVTVVSPSLTEGLKRRWEANVLGWVARKFAAGDLDGAFLVIAATADEAVNEFVYREADRRGILCNAIDQPARCHFYFPAVVRRGDLQIAISTNGLSPSLAQRLRKQFEHEFGPEYGDWLRWLGLVRETLMERRVDFATRKRLLAYVASRESFDRWLMTRVREVVLEVA
jgi:precorrin-2 dehydrogenase / sirohydrochlorin ferrochelatase